MVLFVRKCEFGCMAATVRLATQVISFLLHCKALWFTEAHLPRMLVPPTFFYR
jgi:hypothetical protein